MEQGVLNINNNENKKNNIMDIFGSIMGFMGTMCLTVFVILPHRVMAWILSYTTWVNPDAKQLMLDISPFLGAFTAVVLIIMYLYKIKLYRAQIRSMDSEHKAKYPK